MPVIRQQRSRISSFGLRLFLLAGCTLLLSHGHQPARTDLATELRPISIVVTGIATESEAPTPALSRVTEIINASVETGKITLIPARPRQNEDSLWERLADGFDLDDKSEPAVKAALADLLKHRRSTLHMLNRATPYLWEIVDAVEARQLPGELALLPAIESRFNSRALSHRRARGLWQIMPATAQHLGLDQNWWFDARMDVTESTLAALDYLEYLHRRFHDWALALAAYNCGEARVQRAVDLAEGNKDFWELELPEETQKYVPKLLALSILIEDYDDFDLQLPEIPNQQTTDTVLFDRQIDLALAAKSANIDLTSLQFLNPGMLRWATPPGGPHRLRVPAGKSKQLQSVMDGVSSSQWTQWQIYRVNEDDNLDHLALRSGIQLADLKAISQMNGENVYAGLSLILPGSTQLDMLDPLPALAKGPVRFNSVRLDYRVLSGDTLSGIAKKFRVSVPELNRWNGLDSGSILRPGKTLIVWIAPASAKSA